MLVSNSNHTISNTKNNKNNDLCFYNNYFISKQELDEFEKIKFLLNNSKKFSIELIKLINVLLDENIDIKPHQMYEQIVKYYPGIIKKDSLCFGDAYRIDIEIYGLGGCFWRCEYGFPTENDPIIIDGETYKACNVGIFTFSIEN